jgi:flagellin
MRVGTNVAALNSQIGLGRTQDKLSTALARLSSGLRINASRDDAGGLAIAETLRAQVRGAAQARRNAQDGLSLINTAEGGAGEIHASLQRLRELSVQAANGVYTLTQRTQIQAEVTQLVGEIDRIAGVTTFNGIQVLTSSSFTPADYATVQNTLENSLLGDAWQLVQSAYPLTLEGAPRDLNIYFDDDAPGGTLAYVSASGGPFYPALELHVDMNDFLPGGGVGSPPLYNDRILAHELVHALMFDQMNYGTIPTWFAEGIAEFVHGADERVRGDLAALGGDTPANRQALLDLVDPASWPGTSAAYSGAYMATRYLGSLYPGGIDAALGFLENDASPTAFADMLANAGHTPASFDAALADGTALAWVNANMTLADNLDTGGILGSDYGGPAQTAASVVTNGTGLDTPFNEIYNPPTASTITLQVGADAGETLALAGVNATAGALGVDAVDLTTAAGALAAIDAIEAGITALSQMRAELGAQANRLEHAIDHLGSEVEHQAGAESRIRDADLAAESVALTRSRILAQAGTSVLAAANARPATVRTLLGLAG